jgi:predicted O-methyltransferase YrrM
MKPNAPTQLPYASEGYVTERQQARIPELLKEYAPHAKRIMEIGFNAGHSADLFLRTNPDAQVVSFDIGMHNYVRQGKDYIDAKYPGRHTLVLGDSTQSVPEYKTDEPFDVIFIDGGHSYDVASADVANCKRLAHANTLVIMDDTIRQRLEWVRHFNVGPNKAWLDAIEAQEVEDLGFVDLTKGRGMSWGRYRL